jgi:hypothetical protein
MTTARPTAARLPAATLARETASLCVVLAGLLLALLG